MLDAHSALAGDGGPYDLPRALLREREKQEREAWERAQAQALVAPAYPGPLPGQPGADGPVKATVTQLQLPFLRLVLFFIKAAFAAIPALIILSAMAWAAGHLLQLYFPELVKMQILIQFPN
jgi:hypothetical protein